MTHYEFANCTVEISLKVDQSIIFFPLALWNKTCKKNKK